MTRRDDLRFDGWIAGLGTTSGVRVVVGCWLSSPYGEVADVMVETAAGHRVLLAPSPELADFVSATYRFDEVVVGPVALWHPGGREDTVRVRAGDLDATFEVGDRTVAGRLLSLLPRWLSGRLWWVSLCDLVAGLLVPGVRTVGSAGGGRREWYAARDNRRLSLVSATWRGQDAGGPADVTPPVRFGFGSTPRQPSWTRLTTTVRLPASVG